jgi:hypothetical protein
LSKTKFDSVPRDITNGLAEGFRFYEGKLFDKFSTHGDVLLYTVDPNTRKKLYIAAENKVGDLLNNPRFIVSQTSLT